MVSLIVALSENGVIGRAGDMPWHLSSDLRRFKMLTMGHHMVMGRKTWDSIGRLLPGRTTIIITRNPEFSVPGAVITHNLDAALQTAADDPEVFIVGGGEIYRMAFPLASRLYVTRVHTSVEGDTTFPEIDWSQWQLTGSEQGHADEQNDHDFTFETWDRLGHRSGEQELIA